MPTVAMTTPTLNSVRIVERNSRFPIANVRSAGGKYDIIISQSIRKSHRDCGILSKLEF